jgi:cell wall-associated NlpC family hydrolase
MFRTVISLVFMMALIARAEEPAKPKYGQPAVIGTDALKEFETLSADRKKLIEGALAVARDSPWLPYLFGGSAPEDGGFDCSGAMYFVLGKAGLKPPRTSADQYFWVKDAGSLHEPAPGITALDDPSMAKLQPGDLLFWGGTYEPTDGRKANITHVALFLGHEKKDGRAVMINATDGRSYRGTKASGFGVYDFVMPKSTTRAVFKGYGTPPGIGKPD